MCDLLLSKYAEAEARGTAADVAETGDGQRAAFKGRQGDGREAEEKQGSSGEALAKLEKCNLKVGRVESCEPVPESDKLYLLKVRFGDEVRQVCSGLQKFVKADDLVATKVMAITNLKPAKMAGLLSEAMVLACEPAPGVVRVLRPDPASADGERVHALVDGKPHVAKDAPPKKLSSTVWADVQPRLLARGGAATYEGLTLAAVDAAATARAVAADAPDGAAIR